MHKVVARIESAKDSVCAAHSEDRPCSTKVSSVEAVAIVGLVATLVLSMLHAWRRSQPICRSRKALRLSLWKALSASSLCIVILLCWTCTHIDGRTRVDYKCWLAPVMATHP